MRKLYLIFCAVLIVLASVAVCFADEHHGGHHGGHHGDWHGHSGWGIFIGPGPYYYPPPAYPYPAYPYCERVCSDRVVPVCRYDDWGDRWCHDELVRDCRRVCY